MSHEPSIVCLMSWVYHLTPIIYHVLVPYCGIMAHEGLLKSSNKYFQSILTIINKVSSTPQEFDHFDSSVTILYTFLFLFRYFQNSFQFKTLVHVMFVVLTCEAIFSYAEIALRVCLTRLLVEMKLLCLLWWRAKTQNRTWN